MTTENPSHSVLAEENDILRTLPADFVTFYSFKGGVGRSMALINIAGIMAGRGFRILVLDMDLEAPGISFLLPAALNKPRTEPIPGFIDLMLKVVSEPAQSDLFRLPAETALDNYIHSYPIPEKLIKSQGGSLHIMPAGVADAGYQQRLEDLNLPGLYQAGPGQNLMLVFKKIIQDSFRFDFVFIDSRTGFSDEAGICTRDLADRVMVISGLNNQNIHGTASFLRALRSATDGKKPVSIVLSPIPIGEDELREQRMAIAQSEFCQAYGQPFDFALQIPYHPRLALTEEPYIFRSNQGYLHDAYYRIEEKLREGLGLIANRLIQDAERAIESRNYSLALQKLLQSLKLDQRGQILQRIGIKLLQAPQIDSAAYLLYDKLISALDTSGGLLAALAISISQSKNALSDLAEVAWRRLASLSPANAHHLGNFAFFLTDIRQQHDEAEQFYRRAIEADPKGANHLGNFALFLTKIRQQHDAAEQFYRRAIEAAPKDAHHLGNFALFLTNIRQQHDEAEQFYRRAIEAAPKDAHHLGNFALFLTNIRQQHDEAEQFYRRAIEADPKDAHHLGNFAFFLTDIRQQHDEAEQFYRRAIEADPKGAHHLGNFATFLKNIRQQHDEAEQFYRRAIEADPKHPNILGNFANFLTNIRQQHDEAEQFYRRAIEADPKHPNILGNFALFLTNIRQQHDEAEQFYRRAIEAAPKHPNNLGNFAGFLFAQGRVSEGRELLARALAGAPQFPLLLAELYFYSYAHIWKDSGNALPLLKGVLDSGGRSPDWPLDRNVSQSAIQGHPHPELVAALAAVVTGKAPIESLDVFPIWTATPALPIAK